MLKLTKKQENILKIISDYMNTVGYPPSYREICKKANLASPSTVLGYLEILKKKGYITWEPGLPRTLQIIEFDNAKTASL